MLMKMNYKAGGIKITIKDRNQKSADEIMNNFANRVRYNPESE